jgi:uncharacterized protein YegJ (DUF2314 family)
MALLSCHRDNDRVVRREGEPDVFITQSDPELARIRHLARATVDSLLTRWNASPRMVTDVYIKTPLQGGSDPEHIWVEVASIHGPLIKGTIANDPLDTTLGHFGDTLVVDTSEISDWRYTDSLGEHGGLTTRFFRERQHEDSLHTVRTSAH